MPDPIVFLDKDGTLVEDVPYTADPAVIRLTPGAGEAVRALHAGGWRVVVVTNQSGVARGSFPESALAGVEARVRNLLATVGVPLAGFEYCPHHPDGVVPGYAVACACRKPEPGMILTAAARLGVDPRACWMVGDRPADVEAGRRAGCRAIRLTRGGDVLTETDPAVGPPAHAPDLLAAAAIILGGTTAAGRGLNPRDRG